MKGMPMTVPGLRVGLLGGSFDPPHQGHRHITLWALKRFRLDQVWWLVTPGNPLKPSGPAPMQKRLLACRDLVRHPRVIVTDVEAHLGTRYTADTIRALRDRAPGVRFMWLMGADNLADFHRWDNWTTIMESTPIGVLGRPGDQLAAGLSAAAKRYARGRRRGAYAGTLIAQTAPAWCLLSGPMLDISSTELRNSTAWRTPRSS